MAARKKMSMSDLGRSRHDAKICESDLQALAGAIQKLLNEGKTAAALLQLKKCISARRADSNRFKNTNEEAKSIRAAHERVILRVEGLRQKIIDNAQLLTTGGGTVQIKYVGYLKIMYKPINSDIYVELKKSNPTPYLYSNRKATTNPTRKATMNPLLKSNKNSTSKGTRRKTSL